MNRLKLKRNDEPDTYERRNAKGDNHEGKRQTDRRAFGKKKRLHQAVAAAAAFVLIAGAVIPSQAAIRYFVKRSFGEYTKAGAGSS